MTVQGLRQISDFNRDNMSLQRLAVLQHFRIHAEQLITANLSQSQQLFADFIDHNVVSQV